MLFGTFNDTDPLDTDTDGTWNLGTFDLSERRTHVVLRLQASPFAIITAMAQASGPLSVFEAPSAGVAVSSGEVQSVLLEFRVAPLDQEARGRVQVTYCLRGDTRELTLDVPYRCTFVRGAGRVNIEPTVTVSQEYQRWRERYDAHNAETNTIVKEALDHGVRSERDRDFLFGVLLPNILREACRRVSKISKTDLDEVVQNTMVKIVTKDVLGNMPADARQNVRAYFATVAKNALIDSIRELRRRRGREKKGARPEAIEETPRAPTDVGAVAASALRRAFFSLTSSERAVLVVHFHDGLSGAEAAERLEIGKANPEDAAYQAKRRAISAMCNRLRQDDVFALAVAVVMRDREQSNAAAGELLGASVMEAAGAVLELVPDKLRELVTGMLKVSTWKLNGPDGLAPCFSLD